MLQQINLLSFISKVNIGAITDKKITAIRQTVFSGISHNVIDIDGNKDVIYISNDNKFQLSLSPIQINLTIQNVNNEDKAIINSVLTKLYSTLMLDDVMEDALIRCLFTPVTNYNTMNYLKNIVTVDNSEIEDQIGIGLRYFLHNQYGLTDEFKVEPAINNLNQFYIEGLYHFKKITINEVEELFSIKYNDFIDKIKKLNIEFY